MKKHSIIFSGPMARAILEGRKTQTRRVIRPQPAPIEGYGDAPRWVVKVPGFDLRFGSEKPEHWLWNCPYGKAGDRLWVRETFGFSAAIPVGFQRSHMESGGPWDHTTMAYHADDPSGNWCWRSSKHMPRWASRLMLEVREIRVEQVKDITEGDAEAEGVEPYLGKPEQHGNMIGGEICETFPDMSFRRGFADLWDGINAKRGYSWDTNPWVWVIEFQRLQS